MTISVGCWEDGGRNHIHRAKWSLVFHKEVTPDSFLRADGGLIESYYWLAVSQPSVQKIQISRLPWTTWHAGQTSEFWILAQSVILSVIHVTFLLRAWRPRVRKKGKQLRGLQRFKEEANEMRLVWALLTQLQGQRILNLPLASLPLQSLVFLFRCFNGK